MTWSTLVLVGISGFSLGIAVCSWQLGKMFDRTMDEIFEAWRADQRRIFDAWQKQIDSARSVRMK